MSLRGAFFATKQSPGAPCSLRKGRLLRQKTARNDMVGRQLQRINACGADIRLSEELPRALDAALDGTMVRLSERVACVILTPDETTHRLALVFAGRPCAAGGSLRRQRLERVCRLFRSGHDGHGNDAAGSHACGYANDATGNHACGYVNAAGFPERRYYRDYCFCVPAAGGYSGWNSSGRVVDNRPGRPETTCAGGLRRGKASAC